MSRRTTVRQVVAEQGAGVTSIRFGLRIPPCADAAEVASCAASAERVGFDVAWLPDSQFLWRDVWACLALAATSTERITIGTCVTNVETRHPSVTATAAATIAELAPARFVLGLGSGDSAVKTLGLPPTRVAVMEQRIDQLTALLAGDAVGFADREMRIPAVPGSRVPIYLAATGPRMLALAGRRCDGALVLTGFEPDLIAATRAATGRPGDGDDGFDLCVGTICHVTDDPGEAARVVKPYVVGTAQTGGRERLRSIGIDIDPPSVVGGIYPDMSHAVDWDAAADAASEWVTDDMARRYADAFCVVGDSDQVVSRFRSAMAAGATSFYVRHPGSYTLPTTLIDTFGDRVIPALRSA